jgi:hypothetical protein
VAETPGVGGLREDYRLPEIAFGIENIHVRRDRGEERTRQQARLV